jgi:polyphosphate kinase 2 (PPK2 family)
MPRQGRHGEPRVRRLQSPGARVVGFKRPTAEERAHDFLWRVHPHTPGKGEIAIFNRSHYEDVLVTRVHKLIDKDTWTARYRRINEFEALLTRTIRRSQVLPAH